MRVEGLVFIPTSALRRSRMNFGQLVTLAVLVTSER